MRLHAQLGQRGAALRQYQDCVNVLQRELGVEPEAETRQFYQEILQQRTSSAMAAPYRRASEAATPPRARKAPETRPVETPLIGRDVEMAQLREAFDRAAVGGGGFFAVVGEAGIGKSRLVEELVANAERHEARILFGRAHESDQIFLFGPIVDALRSGQIDRDTMSSTHSVPSGAPSLPACCRRSLPASTPRASRRGRLPTPLRGAR